MVDDDDNSNVVPLTGLTFTRESVQVVELDTGNQVNRPDVAARGLSAFRQAADAAGVRVVEPVRLRTMPDAPTPDDSIEGDLDLPIDPDEHLPD